MAVEVGDSPDATQRVLVGGKMLILPWWSLKLARTIDATPEKKREACTAAVNITTHID